MSAPNANPNLNRPVYLARRDVLLEKAIELFPECLTTQTVRKRLRHIDSVLYLLNSALEPAVMAVKSAKVDPHEESLILFLRLVFCYLHSARAMMENECQLDNTRNPLWKFIHREGKAEAAGFARSSEQLLQDVSRLLHMGQEPFRDLQQRLVAAMSAEDSGRYQRAYDDLKAHGPSVLNAQRAAHMRPNFLASS
jgi:hypothetical protein